MTVSEPVANSAPLEVTTTVNGLARCEDPAGPVKRSGWFIFVATFCLFATGLAVLMPSLYSLALKTQTVDPAGKALSLGLVVSIGSAVNIFSAPIIGHLSDISTSRFGRRRPFLIAGIVVATIGFLVIALAPSVPVIIAGWVLALLGAGGVGVAFQTIIVEHIPESQRGKVSALGGISMQFSGVAGVLLGALLTFNTLALFLVPSVVLAIAAVLYWFTIPDTRADPGTVHSGGLRKVFTAMVFNPRKHPDFAFVWAGKFLIQFGLAFFSTYQLYLLLDRLGLTPEEAGGRIALVGGIGVLLTSAGAFVSGWLSDKLRRRKVFIYGAAVLFAVGLALIAFAPDFTTYMIGGLFVLAGAGVFGAVDLALASDVMPNKSTEAGRFMNIYGMSTSIPNALAPAVAPALLLIGGAESNYTALYIAAAVLALGGGLFVKPIRSVR